MPQENNEKFDVGFLLFDISPFLYIGYNGALAILKDPHHNFIVHKSKDLVRSKVLQCMSFAEQECRTIFPVYCYDGFPQWKKEMFEEYKKDRPQMIDPQVKSILKSYLKTFPGLHLYNSQEEADDMICTAKEKLKKKFNITKESNVQFYIFSSDNDLMQLTDSKTIQYSPYKEGQVKDSRYLAEKFNGLESFKKVVLHKICFGDSSDRIEGIFKGKRRGPIVAELNKVKNYNEFYDLDIVKPFAERAHELENIIRLKKDCIIEKKKFVPFDDSLGDHLYFSI